MRVRVENPFEVEVLALDRAERSIGGLGRGARLGRVEVEHDIDQRAL